MVAPRAQQLNRRLRKELLSHRHVEVVYEQHVLRARGRPIGTSRALVHFSVNDILRHVRGRLRRERERERHELLRHVTAEQVVQIHRLARASRAREEHELAVQQQLHGDVLVAHRILRRDYELAERELGIVRVRQCRVHPHDPLATLKIEHVVVDLSADRERLSELEVRHLAPQERVQAASPGVVHCRGAGPHKAEHEQRLHVREQRVHVLGGRRVLPLLRVVLREVAVHDVAE